MDLKRKLTNLQRTAPKDRTETKTYQIKPKRTLFNKQNLSNDENKTQALEEAEEIRRQALAKAAHQREQELAEERERKLRLAKLDARNREEERVTKSEEYRLQVGACGWSAR